MFSVSLYPQTTFFISCREWQRPTQLAGCEDISDLSPKRRPGSHASEPGKENGLIDCACRLRPVALARAPPGRLAGVSGLRGGGRPTIKLIKHQHCLSMCR